MSRARKCDRCGTLYEPKGIKLDSRGSSFNAVQLIDIDLDNKYFTRCIKDLCPECLESFKAWLTMEVQK